MTRLRKALKIKHRNFSDRFNERFHQLSYLILALIIVFKRRFCLTSPICYALNRRYSKGRSRLQLLFSALLPSLPHETPMPFVRSQRWIDEARMGNSDYNWAILAAGSILNLNQPAHTWHSNGCGVLFPAFMVQNLPARRLNRFV